MQRVRKSFLYLAVYILYFTQEKFNKVDLVHFCFEQFQMKWLPRKDHIVIFFLFCLPFFFARCNAEQLLQGSAHDGSSKTVARSQVVELGRRSSDSSNCGPWRGLPLTSSEIHDRISLLSIPSRLATILPCRSSTLSLTTPWNTPSTGSLINFSTFGLSVYISMRLQYWCTDGVSYICIQFFFFFVFYSIWKFSLWINSNDWLRRRSQILST